MSVDPVAGLVAARARSIMGLSFAASAVDSAVDALTAGFDGQGLRELAGLSRSSSDDDVRELLERALVDVGAGGDMPHEFAQILVLRDLALEVLDGRMSLREFTRWAHDKIGHDGPEVSADLVALEDEFDVDETLRGSDRPANLPEDRRRLESFVAAAAVYLANPGSSEPRRLRPEPVPQDSSELIARATGMAVDGRLGEAGRLLRTRLKEDPLDDSLRRALAALYRTAGHPDQAGRYEIAMPDSIPSERDAYLRFLIATGADEERIRSLSILPPDVAIPGRVLTELEVRRRSVAANSSWETVATVGGWCFNLAVVITLVVVYFAAVFGGESVGFIARLGGLISVAMLGISFIGPAGIAATERRRGASIRWGVVASLLLVGSVWATLAVVTA